MKIILKKTRWFTVITTLSLVVVTLFAASGCDKTEIPPKQYTVNFAGEGVDIEPQSITHGNYATAPENPEREGYDFGGWFTDNGTFANEWDFKTDIVTQDTTLYAKWKENTLQETKRYTVNFAGEGVGIEPQSITHGNCATVPENPEREGYDFGGWFTDNGTFANEWDFKTNIVTQDTTLYAKWEENTLQEINLQGTKWKLIGIVDVQSGDLTELEPKDCVGCYTLSFDTDDTFSGQITNNVISLGNYEIDYTTGTLRVTDIIGTEMGDIGDGYLYGQTLWKIQSFTVKNTHPRILHLYYNNGKNYLKYKEIGG